MRRACELLGYDDDSGHHLYLLQLGAPEDLVAATDFPEAPFYCLLVWDAAGVPPEVVSGVVERLMDLGCVSLCTWGRDCERVHDIADESFVWLKMEQPERLPPGLDYLMTTWHDDDSLQDALFFLLATALAQDEFEELAGARVVVQIGGDAARSRALRWALEDPKRFFDSLPDDE